MKISIIKIDPISLFFSKVLIFNNVPLYLLIYGCPSFLSKLWHVPYFLSVD
jgi:hypothetical protein